MTSRPGWTPGALRMAALRAHPDRLKVENHAEDTATVYIYDEISWCGVTAAAVAKELDGITAPNITLRLNSPGGDLFDGIAIYNSLVSHPATVNVQVDGLAASCASVIAMAGDTITMGAGTELMIHDGLAMVIGNAADMTETAQLLNKLSDDIAGFYARRAGGSIADWRSMMLEETWYSGPEAVTAGLADSAVTDVPDADDAPAGVPVAAKFDLSIFNFAGRERSPAPTPVSLDAPPVPAPAPLLPRTFDVAAFRGAVRAAWGTTQTGNYGSLLSDAIRKAQ